MCFLELEICCVASGHWAGISNCFFSKQSANLNLSQEQIQTQMVKKLKEIVRNKKSRGPPCPDFWAQGDQWDQRTNELMRTNETNEQKRLFAKLEGTSHFRRLSPMHCIAMCWKIQEILNWYQDQYEKVWSLGSLGLSGAQVFLCFSGSLPAMAHANWFLAATTGI